MPLSRRHASGQPSIAEDGTILIRDWRVPSAEMPRVTAREAERAIMRDGWRHVGGTGSHRQYEHPTKPGAVTIAHHAGQIIAPCTPSNILRQAGLTVDQLRALL
jgi:predicted RNA binding protein YcfA (HicA-like mRNA interferase family)